MVARGTAKAGSREYEMPPLTFRGRAFPAPSSTPEGRWRHFYFHSMSDSGSEEVWKPIPGYKDSYEASSKGRIRSVDREVEQSNGVTKRVEGTVLDPTDVTGYPAVTLWKHGEPSSKYVHHLVARTFVGDRPEGHEINHKNGDPHDNTPQNLEWVTHQENIQHAYNEGLRASGEDSHLATLSEEDVLEIRRRIDEGERQDRLANEFGVSDATISRIKHREAWAHI